MYVSNIKWKPQSIGSFKPRGFLTTQPQEPLTHDLGVPAPWLLRYQGSISPTRAPAPAPGELQPQHQGSPSPREAPPHWSPTGSPIPWDPQPQGSPSPRGAPAPHVPQPHWSPSPTGAPAPRGLQLQGSPSFKNKYSPLKLILSRAKGKKILHGSCLFRAWIQLRCKPYRPWFWR